MAPADSVAPAGAAERARVVRRLGRKAGFDIVRISRADVLEVERDRFGDWVAEGRHGSMGWITPERANRSADPAATLPGARSVISVARGYWSGFREVEAPNSGRVARYAWSGDYHREMGDRLQRLSEALEEKFGAIHRWYVDTGPLMDKALAARSGLGWYGKNTNILTERFGSFVFLGEIVTTLDLPADAALDKNCGSCRLCVAACPTGALGPDYSIDARRCISYLTIEHRGPIPIELREAIGSWVFGCDICQDVCPPTMLPHLNTRDLKGRWVREVQGVVAAARGAHEGPTEMVSVPNNEPRAERSGRQAVDLLWLLTLSHDEYVETFRGSAIRRAKVWMLRRNASIALGNSGTVEAIGPLQTAMQHDEHPVVRGHAAWALGRLAQRHSDFDPGFILSAALIEEQDETVREEIRFASTLRRKP